VFLPNGRGRSITKALFRSRCMHVRNDMELTNKNKREMIQAVIDEEPEPWIIMKPSRQDPTDPEELCIFENPAEHTQARTEIPLEWFQNQELEKIKRAIQQSLRSAQLQY
jgi:hypothetical protein